MPWQTILCFPNCDSLKKPRTPIEVLEEVASGKSVKEALAKERAVLAAQPGEHPAETSHVNGSEMETHLHSFLPGCGLAANRWDTELDAIEEAEETLEYENDDDEMHKAVPEQRFLDWAHNKYRTDVGGKSMDPAHLQMEKRWNEINAAQLPGLRVMPTVLPLPVTRTKTMSTTLHGMVLPRPQGDAESRFTNTNRADRGTSFFKILAKTIRCNRLTEISNSGEITAGLKNVSPCKTGGIDFATSTSSPCAARLSLSEGTHNKTMDADDSSTANFSPTSSPKTSAQSEGMVLQLGCDRLHQQARQMQQEARRPAAAEELFALKARLERLKIYEGLGVNPKSNGEYDLKLNCKYHSEAGESDERCAYHNVQEIVSPSDDRRLRVPIQRGQQCLYTEGQD